MIETLGLIATGNTGQFELHKKEIPDNGVRNNKREELFKRMTAYTIPR